MASLPDNNLPDESGNAPETPRELNRLEVLRGMRLSVWDGAFATIWTALTTGAFLTGFALWLGADSVAQGFLTAIPTFAGLIQIVSSYLGQRMERRKGFVFGFVLIGRLLWLPILFLPLLMHSGALTAFLVFYALSYICINVTVPAWMSWMSDLVPADHRGRYFARRNMIAGMVGMVIALPAAWFLDFAVKRHHAEIMGFGTLFGLGVIGGVVSLGFLLRQPEPPHRTAPQEPEQRGLAGVLEFYRAPFADRNFRRLMLFNVVFGLGQNFAAPFFTVYALQNLKLGYIWLQIFAMLNSIAALASMTLWGYLADKFGNKPLLAIGVVGTFVLPLLWIPCSVDAPSLTLTLLVINNLIGGMFWAGVGLTQFNLLIRLSPSEKTPVYVATMAAVTGLTGGLAPLVGGAVMNGLQGRTFPLFGFAFSNFHITFAIAAFLRLLGLLFLRSLADSSSLSARDVLQQLGRTNPRAWRDMQQLRAGSDQESRLQAASSLASSRTRLALTELIAALHDPSLVVREEAARALGEIGDPNAVPHLIAAMRDPATGLADEAAEALGRIGDRRANPALIALLQEASDVFTPKDRMAAIRALGALGGPDAAEALLELFQAQRIGEPGSEEMTETLVRALGQSGDSHATGPLTDHLHSEETPRPLRLALIRALGELGDPAALPALRNELADAEADPVLFPLLADALARLGDSEALPALLEGLCRLVSPIARKQAAHAVGTLLDEGEGVYNLLSLEEFARDAGVSRLIEEMQKGQKATSLSPLLSAALEAYSAENYGACLQALEATAQAVLPPGAEPKDSQGVLRRRALMLLANQDSDAIPVEAVLIALLTLRGLLDK